MGKPKFSRKKYETPSHPWEMERIKEENELVKKYGLKNKREIWKAETKLRKYRGQARGLLAKIDIDPQSKKESEQLLMHLNRMSILPVNSTLDDVLTLDTESILSRRLQTLTYLKGLASTPKQARQLICHGHVAIDDKKITIPGYMVTKDEESNISYTESTPLNDTMHPARPRGDFGGVPFKKPEKPKEEVKPEEPSKEEKPAEETPKEEQPPVEKPAEKPEEPATEEKPEEPAKEDKAEEKTEEKVKAEPPVEEKADEPKEVVEEKADEKPSEEKKEEPEKKEEK